MPVIWVTDVKLCSTYT